MSFYDLFSDLCKSKGIKPSRAATELGINRSNVTNWKNGGYTPRGDTLQKIADYFGVTTDFLLTGEQKEKSPSESGEGRAIDVVDDELREYLDELRSRPEKKLLFSVTKNATKEQIEAIVKMVEAMQGREKSE